MRAGLFLGGSYPQRIALCSLCKVEGEFPRITSLGRSWALWFPLLNFTLFKIVVNEFFLLSCQGTSTSLQPRGLLQHTRLLCPPVFPGIHSDSCPLSCWCCLTISSSTAPFFCLQPFLALGSFPVSWLLVSGDQSIGASASVLLMNIQG